MDETEAMAAIPAHMDPSVTRESSSRRATTSGRSGSGTTTVMALSPFHPWNCAPQSTDTMSPGWSTRSPGIPCTTCSFTEMQVVW